MFVFVCFAWVKSLGVYGICGCLAWCLCVTSCWALLSFVCFLVVLFLIVIVALFGLLVGLCSLLVV